MSRTRIRVILLAALAAFAATATVAAGASAAVPSKVTSLGDSITQAFQTCSQAFTNCPENSWATGTSSTVKSIFFRIKEKNSKATETNRSVTGAKVGSLNEQAQKAVSDKAEFVTILIGANDACANPSTSQSSFSSSFQAAINTLEEGLPGVRIYVGSVPNLFHLWEVFHTNSTATSSWESTKECPGIMTEPTSEGTAAKARRAATLAAEEGYNATMASICKAAANCQWDNDTFFNGKFEPSEVSTNDYFHPSITGQASLAATAFANLSFCAAEGFCASLESYESSEVKLAPTAVAVEASSGDFWVAESAQNHMVEFNPERKYVRQFGSAGSGNGQFNGIGAIATNSSGDVYAIDPGNRRVQEFGPEGKYITQWPVFSANAIAVDSEGNVWVDTWGPLSGAQVTKYSSSGTALSDFGTPGSAPGQLGIVYGMAFSGGHLYVAELKRVQEFSTTGEFVTVFDEQGSGAGQSNLPRAIAANPTNGNLYVSEVGSNHVQIFSPAGAFISAFGSPGSGAGQFSNPQGIAMSSAGTVYVADAGNGRISEWKAGEPPTFSAALSEYRSSEVKLAPTAVAVEASSGDFWVAESAQNHMVEFNPERKYVRQFGSAGSGNGQFNGIGAIATNSSGDVYAIDPGNRRVQEFGPEGKYITQWPVFSANAIAVDSEGNVWVDTWGPLSGAQVTKYSSSGTALSDFGTPGSAPGQLGIVYGMAFSGGHLYVAELKRVQEFSTTGEFVTVFDEQGSGAGQSNLPRAIAANPTNGNLYVSEVGSNHVQIFSPAGAFISAFGSPGSGAGQFSRPQGIAAAAEGVVWVADSGNGRVQRWVPGS